MVCMYYPLLFALILVIVPDCRRVYVHNPFTQLQHVHASCTFVIVVCNVHCVCAYTDGSEASLGVGIIVRTIEEFEGTLRHIILYNSIVLRERESVCVCVCVSLCVHVCMHSQVHDTYFVMLQNLHEGYNV